MEVRSRPDGATVVNDAYNANPDSMRAALAALVAMAGQAGARRRAFAVLGVMAELGPHSEAAHVEVGRAAAASGLDRLVVVGEAAAGIAQGAVAGGLPAAAVTVVADAEQAVALLRGQVQGDDVVLVKASRSADLQRVAQALLVDDRLGGDVASVDAGAGA
jgi:UDP-N-acetylmuramoyl-tripeptide--D-alanyl-D-alanine ligase